MVVLTGPCVHTDEPSSASDALVHRVRWDWVTIGGYGGHERVGDDADASAPSSVAIKLQQESALPFLSLVCCSDQKSMWCRREPMK